MKTLQINNYSIEVEKKKIKNMYLRILPPDGRIRISAPMRMKESEIERFVLSKEEWIENQLERMLGNKSNCVLSYTTGEEILLWGKSYPLFVEFTYQKRQVILEDNRIILLVKQTDEISDREKLLFETYRDELSLRVPFLIEKWESIMKVKSSSVYFRNMKTRWGSCNVINKRICLNLQLAKKPPRCLEYVVVHELVHLLERSHNQVFKHYMDKFLPDWRDRKRELNGFTN